jgi:hypothetical protein
MVRLSMRKIKECVFWDLLKIMLKDIMFLSIILP